MSAYTLVSLQTADVAARAHRAPPPEASSTAPPPSPPGALGPRETHSAWDTRTGWKHHLNNLRLLLQPYVCSCLFLSVPVCSCPGLPWSRSHTRKRSKPVSPRSAAWSTPSAWLSQHDRRGSYPVAPYRCRPPAPDLAGVRAWRSSKWWSPKLQHYIATRYNTRSA
jgi:hypothetical protein